MQNQSPVFVLWSVVCIFASGGCANLSQVSKTHQPTSNIRAELLTEAPLGSSLVHVRAVVARHHWPTDSFRQQNATYLAYHKNRGFQPTYAVATIIGGYQTLSGYTTVDVTWEFDAKSHLADVYVGRSRSHDSL